jgi:hypothetical protein
MYPEHLPLSNHLKDSHAESWTMIASAGDFFTAEQRLEFVRVAREAALCEFCQERKAALSPTAIEGEHNSGSTLADVVIDLIHRLRTDPGRLTHSWFEDVTSQISQQEYVEIVSVVTSSVIIDTLHNALGLGVPPLPRAEPGRPRRVYNKNAVSQGAWVPILAADQSMADTGLPRVPNIARSLGLVPSALDLFFKTFRPHYALKDIQLSITQAQAEFVASRVSALNECFY